jgi:hypothetical protein
MWDCVCAARKNWSRFSAGSKPPGCHRARRRRGVLLRTADEVLDQRSRQGALGDLRLPRRHRRPRRRGAAPRRACSAGADLVARAACVGAPAAGTDHGPDSARRQHAARDPPRRIGQRRARRAQSIRPAGRRVARAAPGIRHLRSWPVRRSCQPHDARAATTRGSRRARPSHRRRRRRVGAEWIRRRADREALGEGVLRGRRVAMREFRIAARKPGHRPRTATHHAVYLGPMEQVTDDFGNVFRRGAPTALNVHDWQTLSRGARAPRSCSCSRKSRRLTAAVPIGL